MTPLEAQLRSTIETLSHELWEGRASGPFVDAWLGNFSGAKEDRDVEHLHALYLLSRFMYFGDAEIREMLRVAYRDLYKYPLLRQIRQSLGNTLDSARISTAFDSQLKRTRFFGIGNPSESGSHLLYYFRQENRLSLDLFLGPQEILEPGRNPPGTLRYPDVTHYVFIDDFTGSGKQATDYSHDVLDDLKAAATAVGLTVQCWYFPLVARTSALDAVRNRTKFDRVDAVLKLDDTYKVFEPASRVFSRPPSGLDRSTARGIFEHYGTTLWSRHPLGFSDGQLLLGFHHNTPDNTLTTFWYDEEHQPWQPIFRRYVKV